MLPIKVTMTLKPVAIEMARKVYQVQGKLCVYFLFYLYMVLIVALISSIAENL